MHSHYYVVTIHLQNLSFHETENMNILPFPYSLTLTILFFISMNLILCASTLRSHMISPPETGWYTICPPENGWDMISPSETDLDTNSPLRLAYDPKVCPHSLNVLQTNIDDRSGNLYMRNLVPQRSGPENISQGTILMGSHCWRVDSHLLFLSPPMVNLCI